MARVHLCWDKVPASAVGVVEFERCFGYLLRLERGKEGVGCVRHVRRGLIRVGEGAGREHQRQGEGDGLD